MQAPLQRLEGSGPPGIEPQDDPIEAAFRREVAELTTKCTGQTYWDSVFGLRSVEELWARHLVGVDAGADDLTREVQRRVRQGIERARLEQAIIHLGRAEEWQWQLGSCATGSGEGLASMAQVRMLQASRAWLHGGIAHHLGPEAEAASAEARRLISEVRADRNQMGRREEQALRDLEAFLARSAK
ncbi:MULTISPECIES: hypothetical protein [Sorangium]|uniref:hypothetical protein n=1 Tax=Sorangium TaxID=39643 RepID=UPI0012FFA93F|nr:hypothetical protein [Sorangium cellulosum]